MVMPEPIQNPVGRKHLAAIVIAAGICSSLAAAAVAQSTVDRPGVGLVPLSTRPDLTIQATVTPNPVSVGAPVTYTFTVKNAPGNVRNPRSGSWETIITDAYGIEIVLNNVSSPPTTSTVDIQNCVFEIGALNNLILRCVSGVIAGNGGGVITIPGQAPTIPGPFTVSAEIDVGNRFHEFDETNNKASVTLNVN